MSGGAFKLIIGSGVTREQSYMTFTNARNALKRLVERERRDAHGLRADDVERAWVAVKEHVEGMVMPGKGDSVMVTSDVPSPPWFPSETWKFRAEIQRAPEGGW